MFVIADIEWITNSVGHQSPTQLSATRVDEDWNIVEEFNAFIRPRDREFCDWNHIAYTGGSVADFMCAENAYTVLSDFQTWLNDDDIILWWCKESLKFFRKIVGIILKVTDEHHAISISPYVYAHLAEQPVSRGNPYKIAGARDVLTKVHLHHYSKNDVRVIRELMAKIKYPQNLLLKPVEKPQKKEKKPIILPYQYDPETNLIHIVGCVYITDIKTRGYEKIKTAFRKGFEPCECCKEEYKKEFKERTIDIISRTQYTYIYSPDSTVFHKYTCGLMHSAKYIMGSCNYDKILKTGRRPCKICNPTPDDIVKVLPPKHKENNTTKKLPLPKEVTKALGRQRVALEERTRKLKNKNLTDEERNDVFTLTQPRFAFWAGKGYNSFHLHSCSKLKDVTGLTGFSTYQEAVYAGYTPCRKCKPTSKNDVKLSIPITNRVRENEKIEDLEELCNDMGYSYKREPRYFFIETPTGKWKVHIEAVPLRLEHINLVTSPFENEYHEQPRLFLSFVDLFSYIKRHDEKLMEQEMIY
jgi:methylphosphotriester-DNA--protein-cysteine methyltransferase